MTVEDPAELARLYPGGVKPSELNVPVPVRVRNLLIWPRQSIEAPVVGETVRLTVEVVDLESIDPPLKRGRALVDVEPTGGVTLPDGRTRDLEFTRRSEGCYTADYEVEDPGRHIWSAAAEGAVGGMSFQGRVP